jgi:2-polyprenyl-6-methoxyphenol hydroxylase-like FAD-dependent oxidoreductase
MSSKGMSDTRFPFLLAIPQYEVERNLEERFLALGGTIKWSTEVLNVDQQSSSVLVTLRDSEGVRVVSAEWVVGADGAHSIVRKSLSIAFPGGATGRSFVNVDASLQEPPRSGVGHYYFHRTGMLVIAPLPNDLYRVTASVPDIGAQQVFDIASIGALVQQRTNSKIRVTGLHDAGWGVSRFSVQTRIAETFHVGRVVLAGDAAHIYGPTGAQGMNGGIQDAHALAWRLALLLRGGPDSELLGAYARERLKIAKTTLQHVEGQTKMATLHSPLAIVVRDALLTTLSKRGVLDKVLVPRISQFDITYSTGSRLRSSGPVGKRLPNINVEGKWLYQHLVPGCFTFLIASNARSQASVAIQLRQLIAVYGGLERVVEVLDYSEGEKLLTVLDRSKPALLVVRPDKYVADIVDLTDPDAMQRVVTGVSKQINRQIQTLSAVSAERQ